MAIVEVSERMHAYVTGGLPMQSQMFPHYGVQKAFSVERSINACSRRIAFLKGLS